MDQASVRRSEQDVARAQEELTRAQSAYNVAHVTYTRLADVQKTRPELVAQEEIDVAQGKDLEASAGVSGAKDALAGSQQELLGAKAALDRRIRRCTPTRASRRRSTAWSPKWTPTPERSFPPELLQTKAIRRSVASRRTIFSAW